MGYKFQVRGTVSVSTEKLKPLKVAGKLLQGPLKILRLRELQSVEVPKNTSKYSMDIQCIFASIPLQDTDKQVKLSPRDKVRREIMCQWFNDTIVLNLGFLNETWFSNEAHFLLPGYINSKNSIFWGTAAPNEMLQRTLYSKKCTVWATTSKHGIIRPVWFEDENKEPLTITKE